MLKQQLTVLLKQRMLFVILFGIFYSVKISWVGNAPRPPGLACLRMLYVQKHMQSVSNPLE